jgi:hypothetical protein
MPLVLTRRVRSQALIVRSAPVVAGVGALAAVTILLANLTGTYPDYVSIVRLAILAGVLSADGDSVVGLQIRLGPTGSAGNASAPP